MKTKQLGQKIKGFTIIEVMIVLTIAGLILLIVFLAVPALQRNSRNTQRKDDVAGALAAVSEFVSNNNGTLPTVACGAGNPYSMSTGTCASPTGSKAEFKQGYYTAPPAVTAVGSYTVPGAVPDTLAIVTNAKCNATNNPTATGASTRGVVAVYGLDSGGALVWACQEG
jgi:prepilin-type N-terminal cleavage/methylation domain-containing protein